MKNPTEKKDFHNLVVNQCPSVSGKSTLTYHVGIDEDKRLYLRVVDNSAGGLFSKEWIELAEIENILGKIVGPFTSHALRGLFQSKSNNTPAFLLAVMLKEGLAVRSKASKRGYARGDFERFKTQIQALIDAQSEGKPVKSAKAKKEAQG